MSPANRSDMRLAAAAAVLALAFTLGVVMPAEAAADCARAERPGGAWPSYGHDLANTRHQEAERHLSPENAASLRPAWVFSSKAAGGAGDFTGTPVVADGCVYVGSNQGWVYALNADDGALVWKRRLPGGGTVNNTLVVSGNSVFAYASREGSPYVVSLARRDGKVRWVRRIDVQPGSDAFASPVVFDGLLIVGVSGDAAQHSDESERVGFQGSVVLLNADSGRLVRKIWTIPSKDRDRFDGATVTTPAAVDEASGFAFVGTSSPYRPQEEHPRTNALLKIDVDRSSSTFGRIVDVYKGDTFDSVVPSYSTMPCVDLPIPPPPAIVPTGRGIGACGDVDVDFAAAPNLVRGPDGQLVVAASQKSGRFHAVGAKRMKSLWTTTFAPAQPFGAVSAAYDGRRLYAAAAPPGHAFALDAGTGSHEWVAPILDGAHYGVPMSSANGVVLTVDVKGFLDAYDAESGKVLLHYPLSTATVSHGQPAASFGGVSIARGSVYASVGVQNTGLDPTGDLDGYIVALRPAVGSPK